MLPRRLARRSFTTSSTAPPFGLARREPLFAWWRSLSTGAPTEKYVLALDQGTTSSRAMLFDQRGRIAGIGQMEFAQHYPDIGWAEHDPNEILSTVLKCSEDALARAEATKENISAIGITNQRETTVAWDKETGEPLCNAIVWLDLRTAATAERLSRDGGQDRFRERTGLPVSTYFSAVKMKWLLDNVPAVAAAASKGRCRFGTIESWLIYKLTGGVNGGVHVTDVSNASRYLLMNIHDLAWDEGVCKEVGVPIGALPAIHSNSEIYGTVKGHGILDGLPISGALGDQHAALLGQGCLEPGQSKITYGTGCFTLLNVGQAPVPSSHGLLTTVGWRLGPQAATTYALEGSVACAGRSVQWLRDNLGFIKAAFDIEALARSVEDTGGVTFVPAFSGLFAPHWRSDARAIAVGMTLYTNKAHMCRAVLEAVCFQNMDVLMAMQKDFGKNLTGLRVDGGMTANKLLMEMQADLIDQEVHIAQMPEATALGAAFAAGLTTGFWERVEDIHKVLDSNGGHWVFSPKMDVVRRQEAHARWADAIDRSLGLERWGRR